MGNSPTSPDNEDDDSEESVEVPPGQLTFDETDSSNGEDTEESTSSSMPNSTGISGGAGAGAGAGVGAGGGVDVGVSDGDEPDENSVSEDAPEQEVEEEPDSPEDSEGTEESESKEEPDEEDDDEEEGEATFVIYTDPWDSAGWGNEPDIRCLQEDFGEKLSVSYEPLPPRAVTQWTSDHQMPAVEEVPLPDSTALSWSALVASQKQRQFRPYLRRLRIAVQSEGRDIERIEVLRSLAEDVGLNPDQLVEDMESLEPDVSDEEEANPQIVVIIDDIPHLWTDNIEYGRAFARIIGEGITPEPTEHSIPEFVEEYGTVATEEVMEAYQYDRQEATDRLQESEDIHQLNLGDGMFWVLE